MYMGRANLGLRIAYTVGLGLSYTFSDGLETHLKAKRNLSNGFFTSTSAPYGGVSV